MEQSPAPANVVDSSFQRHRHLNLPQCYGFHASDEQLLELKEPKTCPIHNISDVYSSTPETLTGAYEQGGNDKWFFFATKKYHDVTSRDVRVTTDGGGHWIRKGAIKKFFDQNNTLLGFKRTQDFYAQGMDLAYWRMEELSLRTEVCIELYR
ncbi:hypothetical protein Bca52824_007657 [Brassica carinata]|uniref:NAC domain-containing protein n=1 Tax=Brassica carinata TaxID=52824 RepID=A0A8X7W6M5_BRACI|nr:hypothetical protein Bca52824_007657 [Brassica carinata]